MRPFVRAASKRERALSFSARRLLRSCAPWVGFLVLASSAGAAPRVATSVPAAEAPPPSDASKEPTDGAAESWFVEAPAAVESAKEPAPSSAPPSGELGMRAYEEGLRARRLAPTETLSAQRLREEWAGVEFRLSEGRLGEAIAQAAALVESPRFEPFRESAEGRGLRFVLGDALGRAGAYDKSRAYLVPLLAASDVEARRAVRALVDFGLESGDPAPFVAPIEPVLGKLSEELRGDVAYARGRAHEKAGQLPEALAVLSGVGARSRYWAQSVYLRGLIEAERGRLKEAEALFCKVADPKLTPREAPVFGGGSFFEVRDLARLGLGRVAHESYRFDDAQYYYYLVPRDSRYLPESLYEAATTRYEAGDYQGAREYLDELAARKAHHPYEDERYILDAYVDLAACKFSEAADKLAQFHRKYEPVLAAAQRIKTDRSALTRLIGALRQGTDPALANLGVEEEAARSIGALIRVDPGYAERERRLVLVERELAALDQVERDLKDARARLAQAPRGARTDTAPRETALRPQAGPLVGTQADLRARFEAQRAELQRLVREAEASGKVSRDELAAIRRELAGVELRARSVERGADATAGAATGGVASERAEGLARALEHTLSRDLETEVRLRRSAEAARAELEAELGERAAAAVARLELRLARLLHRARLGRIETVLGKKRALEVEIEALSQGFLPPALVDSLDVARYLGDDEEYWPDDGEDWADEYVGGEGLR